MGWIGLALWGLLAAAGLLSWRWAQKKGEEGLFYRYDGRRLGLMRYAAPMGGWLMAKLPFYRKEPKERGLYAQLRQMVPEAECRTAYRMFLAQRLGAVIAVLLFGSGTVLIGLGFLSASGPFSLHYIRGEFATGTGSVHAKAGVDDGENRIERSMVVEVPAKSMTHAQKEACLGAAAEYITAFFREKDAYTEEPVFPGAWEYAYFSYASQEPDYMRDDGKILGEWPKERKSIPFQITVWVEELNTELETKICLAAADELPVQRQLELLEKAVRNGSYVEETQVRLPQETIGGKTIYWSRDEAWQSPWVWLGALGAALLLLWVHSGEQLRSQVRERQKKILQAYPDMVNAMLILMGAGLTQQNAWLRITEKYEKRREEGKREPLYEAMLHAAVGMQNGVPFTETLREFGAGIRIREIRKFVNLLLSDRKRGDERVLQYLKEMNEEAWEQKKKLAKERTEEADTRLLLPLMMMLVVILVVVMAPAIMTIRG